MPKDQNNILHGRNLLDLAEGVVVVLDHLGCVVGINRIGCDILGANADDVVGHNWFEEFVTKFDRENSYKYFKRILDGEMTLGIYAEDRLITKNGTSRTLRWNNTLLRDPDGIIRGVLSLGSPVGRPQDIHQELRKTSDRFEEYEKAKSEFVITVSHELRTPLTIFKNIISNALAGSSGRIRKKLRRELEIAGNAVDRLAGIVSDFLDISSIEADKLKLRLTPIIIQTVVTDAVEMFHSIIKDNNMAIEFTMPDAALFVEADYDKIMQVMANLLENAAKFVPNCGGHLFVRIIDAGNDVTIEIEDNGPGIEIEDVNRVFGRFIQIGRHVGAGEHGTGLGLTIAKELVEMHGGRIWAENIPNSGAKFSILLPKHYQADLQEVALDELVTSVKSQVEDITKLCKNEGNRSNPENKTDSIESTPPKNS